MKFERLVSSLDAKALSRTAEALLRLLSGGAPERGAPLPDPAAGRRSRTGAVLPLSAAAEGPLPGAGGAGLNALAAETGPEEIAERPAARSGEAAAEGSARAEMRRDADAARRRSPGAEAAEDIARLAERLADVSERNRRALGAEAGTETPPPYGSAGGDAAAGGSAAGAMWSPAFPAPRAGIPGAAADAAGADAAAVPFGAAAAARSFFDAEAVSEFFRRDSRRYDSGSSDQGETCL